MGRLFLVRHAKPLIDPTRHPSEWNLDPAGEPLLDHFAGLPHWASAHRIVSSREPKAFKTADRIARRHHLPPPETVSALGELHKGSLVPNHAEVVARLFRFPDEPAADGWETASAALARFADAVSRLIQSAQGRDLIVVSCSPSGRGEGGHKRLRGGQGVPCCPGALRILAWRARRDSNPRPTV